MGEGGRIYGGVGRKERTARYLISTGYGRCFSDPSEAWILYNPSYTKWPATQWRSPRLFNLRVSITTLIPLTTSTHPPQPRRNIPSRSTPTPKQAALPLISLTQVGSSILSADVKTYRPFRTFASNKATLPASRMPKPGGEWRGSLPEIRYVRPWRGVLRASKSLDHITTKPCAKYVNFVIGAPTSDSRHSMDARALGLAVLEPQRLGQRSHSRQQGSPMVV